MAIHKYKFFLAYILVLFTVGITQAAKPTGAVKFVILQPANSTVGTPVTVTVQAQKTDSTVDTNYQNDVTLVTSGSATGGGLVDIVNGVGTRAINDSVAETITLSLSDTQATGLDVSSTKNMTFAPVGGSAVWHQIKFWFRDDDGTEVTATGFGTQDTGQNTNLTEVIRGTVFRLRFQIKVTDADGTISPRLEFKEGTDCSTGSWTVIISANNNFALRLSPNFNDGAATTQQLTGGPNFVAGQILESTNPASALGLLKNKSTEYEWSLQVANEIPLGTTYSFRITNNGTALNSYEQCPSLTTQSPPSTGGGSHVAPTTVIFSGQAFPGAKITIVEKNPFLEIPIRQEAIISEKGEFMISFIGILQIDHSYGLIIEDKDGRRTQTKFYNIDTVSNSLTEKDIFVSPTIDLYRSAVTKGDFIKVIGYASAGNKTLVQLDNNIIYETTASSSGQYQMLINTARLSFGNHTLRAKQQEKVGLRKSDWSATKSFTVAATVVPEADFNGDGIIDVKDWSVFLSLWNNKNSERRKILDLNQDGKVDLSDLSIFLRAYRYNK